MSSTLKQIQGITQYFENYRDDEFSTSLVIAKGIATEMGVDALFPVKRRITRSLGRLSLMKVIATKQF